MSQDGNTSSLGDAIRKFLDSYRLTDKFNEGGIREAWEKVMGTPVLHRTLDLKLHGRKLTVKLNSAPLRQELSFETEKIRTALNKELGQDFLEEVIFR